MHQTTITDSSITSSSQRVMICIHAMAAMHFFLRPVYNLGRSPRPHRYGSAAARSRARPPRPHRYGSAAVAVHRYGSAAARPLSELTGTAAARPPCTGTARPPCSPRCQSTQSKTAALGGRCDGRARGLIGRDNRAHRICTIWLEVLDSVAHLDSAANDSAVYFRAYRFLRAAENPESKDCIVIAD
jgi:hypothetical protein